MSLQTRLPDNVIVVDDGSSDLSPQMVKHYVAPFPLTLLQQVNEGPASARNKGIVHAEETLIAFLDADDQWLPEKLEKQLALYEELIRKGHRVGLVDCYQFSEFRDGKRQLETRRKCGNHFVDFIHENIINGTSGVLVAREVIVALGGFDQTLHFGEDRLLWTRIAEHWEIHTVPQVLGNRGAMLTKQQRIHFVLANHVEFLNAFSRRGEHPQVITV